MSVSNTSSSYQPYETSAKPSKAELLAERRHTLKAQLGDLRYGFVEREVTLLSSSQTAFIRYGIDGRGREQARVRLLRPLNRSIRSIMAKEQRSKAVTIARTRDISRLIGLRDDAELHHVIPVSLLPIDEAPSGKLGDQIAWWQEAAHDETNLVSVASEEHTLIHQYLMAQNLYSTTAHQNAERNISRSPVIVKASIPVRPGTLWMSAKPRQLDS